MPVTATAEGPSLLERVWSIESTLRAHAAEAEKERRLPAAAFQAMYDQGLYHVSRPRAFGGLEIDPITSFQVFEEVSRIDSAAGWNLQLGAGADMFGPWLPDEGARESFGEPGSVSAGSFFPAHNAKPVDGGYVVSGQQCFVSGAHNASWLVGLSHIYDHDNGPRLADNGAPIGLITVFPARDATIVDNWNTLGMRGTGSHDVRLQNVFVPERRTAVLAPLEKPGSAYRGPLYRLSLWPVVAALSTVSLGIARAAIDDLMAMAGRKTPAYTAKTLRDRETVHRALGESEAILGAARAYLYEALREAWDRAQAGDYIDMQRKMKLQMAGTHAAASAARVVDLIHAAVGASGIREEQRFQRHFRDAHTITQHAFISASRYDSAGQHYLDVPIEWPFYAI